MKDRKFIGNPLSLARQNVCNRPFKGNAFYDYDLRAVTVDVGSGEPKPGRTT